MPHVLKAVGFNPLSFKTILTYAASHRQFMQSTQQSYVLLQKASK